MRSNRRKRFSIWVRFLFGACVVFCAHRVESQETELVRLDSEEIKALQTEYESLKQACGKALEKIAQTHVRYIDSTLEEGSDARKEWEQLKLECQLKFDELEGVAKQLFDAQEKPPVELAELVFRIQGKTLRDGFAGEAFRIGQKLIAAYPDKKEFQRITALAAIKVNEFEFAKKFYSEDREAIEKFEEEYSMLFGSIDELVTKFEREKQFRERDAENELPLVTIKTNRGVIKIELFEDQAPGTVANFISLTEQGFYNGKDFHWVLKGFGAQIGRFGHQRPVDINYCILDEFDREDARHHFRGSVTLAKSEVANSGNESFFICLEPVPFQDGKRTVFGRVVEGLDLIDSITHTFQRVEDGEPEWIPETRPDYIEEATVTRKRAGSEYKINKVPRVGAGASQ